ncbi:hypothetical protein MOQ_003213 [Trypanosoma cruzi marinkellei]|uniref:Doublecortin domain-containing protein n=1 Tax=Trypanosoma cruzi marinkellei TaxID=85056 RepID=K2N4M7_TRYCR|nr:hypothetical protein MOQ_003213 [Trypanosoma cruzi marinkellei]
MLSAAARREEIQKKIELLRQEREREKRAFDELASRDEGMTPSQIAEAARKKATEEAPTCLQVGGTTISVGDYVETIDDPHALLVAENGIFVPDPVKQVYLGERGKVTCILPSFQEKSAVEIVFADGASKVFLTECLSLGQKSKSKKSFAPKVSQKAVYVDAEDPHVPEFVPPLKPEPLLQPSWSNINIPSRKPKARLENLKPCKPPTLSTDTNNTTTTTTATATTNTANTTTDTTATLDVTKETTTLMPSVERKDSITEEESFRDQPKTNFLVVSNGVSSASCAMRMDSETLGSHVKTDQSIGLVKEVLSERQRRKVSAREGLGSPIDFDAPAAVPLIGRGERDNLLKTPRVDPITYKPSKKWKGFLANGNNESAIPTRCPAGYRARFSTSDKNTKIPRLDGKQCMVAGVLPQQKSLKFNLIAFPKGMTKLQAVLSMLTDKLNWRAMGHTAKRLFTKEGVEIMKFDAIRSGMLFLVTPGHAYTPEPVAKTKVNNTTSTTAIKTTGTLAVGRHSRPTSAPVAADALVVHNVNLEPQQAPVKETNSLPSQVPKSSYTLSAQKGRQRVSGKGIVKPIYVRVFSNGEYGDCHYDPFPFRTVTLRPIHKTIRAVLNTIERELEWNSLGKKVETLYDATGSEITSVEELVDGQSIVASSGDRFVIPHPKSVLHQDVMKLLGNSHATPIFTGGHP